MICSGYFGVTSGALQLLLKHLFEQRTRFRYQLDRQRGEVSDEVQRILDFVGNTGGQHSQRCHLFLYQQLILRGLQLEKGLFEFLGFMAFTVHQNLQLALSLLKLSAGGMQASPHVIERAGEIAEFIL